MTTVCNCSLIHMIGTDGGLRHIPQIMAETMQQKGWKIIVNPKRTYYPEHDQTSANYVKEGQSESCIEPDMLQYSLL